MSFQTFMFKTIARRSDAKRDASLVVPDNIHMDCDINYLGNNDKWNLLDVYYEKGTEGVQPTIISIHGGGYIYGSKEIYKHYGVYLASLGFTFVNAVHFAFFLTNSLPFIKSTNISIVSLP